MQRHSIPTARYRNFSRFEDAREYIEEVPYQLVLKCTGIAAGVCDIPSPFTPSLPVGRVMRQCPTVLGPWTFKDTIRNPSLEGYILTPSLQKGVILPTSKDQAQAALKQMMVEKEFGSAGRYMSMSISLNFFVSKFTGRVLCTKGDPEHSSF